jgi:hydrogenase maturation factor
VSAPPRDPAGAESCVGPGCLTCGDVAVPMRVVAIDDAAGLAICEPDGPPVAGGAAATAHPGREEVLTALVGPVVSGDRLLVHAGVALVRLGKVAGPDTP